MRLSYFYKKKLKPILSSNHLDITIKRLAHQILENNTDIGNTVIIGLQPRGVFLSDRIVEEIRKEGTGESIPYGKLDITFYRDDIRKELHVATGLVEPAPPSHR